MCSSCVACHYHRRRAAMDDVLLRIVLDRLDEAGLPDGVESLVLAACDGVEQLTAALGGEVVGPTVIETAGRVVEPAGAYLGSVRVEGFRGIGPEAVLGLASGAGLTLVIGRNGSGKSSFAEALELLLTQDSRRWSTRSAVWKDGWRNVHHPGRTHIQAELVVDGQAGVTKVTRSWEAEAGLEDSTVTVQQPGAPRADLAALGWERALVRYRPFLSYNELGSMFDEGPTKLYDVLALVLGLEELAQAEKALKEARLERKRLADTSTTARDGLRAALEASDDERARRCLAALNGRRWDLGAVRAVLVGDPVGVLGDAGSLGTLRQLANLPGPSQAVVSEITGQLRDAAGRLAALHGTDADHAHRVARLLGDALAFHEAHGDGDCPVCGRAAALDATWRAEATAQRDRFSQIAADVEEAIAAAGHARRAAHALLLPAPAVLAEADTVGVDTSGLAAAWSTW